MNIKKLGYCCLLIQTKGLTILTDPGNFSTAQNTGYFIDNKLFYPGDSFCIPDKTVDVLALPVAGGWCRIRDSVRYALAVKPHVAFPVHGGMLVEGRIGSVHKALEKVLSEAGVKWVVIGGDEVEV